MIVFLRPAVASDAAAIVQILVDARLAFMPYAPSVHTEPEILDWVRTHLVPSGGVTVAQHNHELVGFVAVTANGAFGKIEQMYVAPLHVGKGIGTQMLFFVLRFLPLPVRLQTFQENTLARRFYEARLSSSRVHRRSEKRRALS